MPVHKEQLLSKLHYFIFGATIVGETAVTSLIVSNLGSDILGNLYLLNGLILLTLPLLFFKKIDTVNRGVLLKKVLKIAPVFIIILFLLYELLSLSNSNSSKYLIVLLYPVSYLLKTVLFLTFWTMAADVSEPAETKALFPKVASFGFLGGLSGAFLSWGLLYFFKPDFIILFWAILYIVAYIYTNHVVDHYNEKMIPKEVLPGTNQRRFQSLILDTKEVFKNSLVRYIAILHYGIFISIFLVDFHFWQQCAVIFDGPGKLSQFQYGFYIIHSIVTIGILHYLTPDLIATRGFTRIFSYLPITLFAGSFLYLLILLTFGANPYTFLLLILWQLFRYISFENFFSPIYQMFFAAVDKEKRGRAKTVIEGLVKPLAIISASIIIMLIGHNSIALMIFLVALSIYLVKDALQIKHAYMKSLVEGSSDNGDDDFGTLIANIGSDTEKECIDILRQFALFSSLDMKRLAIKLLVRIDQRESIDALNELVMSNDVELAREAARYVGEISHQTPLVAYLVQHDDNTVWHRAVQSLVFHKAHLGEFRDYLFRYMFSETSHSDQVYAGIYMWQKGSKSDQQWLRPMIENHLVSDSEERQELAILAYTMLRIPSWEEFAIAKLSILDNSTTKVVIRAILESGTEESKYQLLCAFLDRCSSCTNDLLYREIYTYPHKAVEAIDRFIKSHPEYPEYSKKLIKSVRSLRLGEFKSRNFKMDGIQLFAQNILEKAYSYASTYHLFKESDAPVNSAQELFEIALKERLFAAAEVALDVLVLQDETGFIAEGRREIRIADEQGRVAIIELLEASKDCILKDLVIPILERCDWNVYYDLIKERETAEFHPLLFLKSYDVNLVRVALFWFFELGDEFISKMNLFPIIDDFKHSKDHHIVEISSLIISRKSGQMSSNRGTLEVLNRVLFLKKSQLFSPVSAARLVQLAEGVHEVVYREGDLISREGDRANHLYIIKEGHADIVISNDNNPVKFAELNTGDAYGEVGLFNQDIRSASVVATTRCKVFVLSRSYLKKMVAQIPELANTFLQVFGMKLQQSHDEVIRLQQELNSKETL